MISPNYQRELSEEATECPQCRATGITAEPPQEPGQPNPQSSTENFSREAGSSATVGGSSKSVTWHPKQKKVEAWVKSETASHYDVLELNEAASNTEVEQRIKYFEDTLERWANDGRDGKFQQLGKEGKEKLQRLKKDFENRDEYNKTLAQRRSQKKKDDLLNDSLRYQGDVRYLRAFVWQLIQERAASEGLSKDEIEEVLQRMREERGIQTGLSVADQEARSVEQWLKIVYSHDFDTASIAVASSLQILSDGGLGHWLRAIDAFELSNLAEHEKANGERGLWRVIWRAEEIFLPDSLEYRNTKTAYKLTGQLVIKFGQDQTEAHFGAEARFHHAVNCALLGLTMWETYFRNALKPEPDRERIKMLAEMPRYREAFGNKLPEIIGESSDPPAPEPVIKQEAVPEGEPPERPRNAAAATRTEERPAVSLPQQPEKSEKIEPTDVPLQQPKDKPPTERVTPPESPIPGPLPPAIAGGIKETDDNGRGPVVELAPKRDELGPSQLSQPVIKSEEGKQTSETKQAETASSKSALVAEPRRKTIGPLVPEIISIRRRDILVLALIFVCIVGALSARACGWWPPERRGSQPTPTPTVTPTPAPTVLLDVKLLTVLSAPQVQMVNEVAWGPTGEFLASVSEETVVRLWPMSNGGQPRELLGQVKSGRAATFSPNGQIVAVGSADGAIRLWEASSGGLLMPPLLGHKGRVFIVRFSGDGQTLVSAGGDNADKTVRRWRVSDGQPLGDEVKTPNELIVAVNPDKQVLGLYNSSQGFRLRSLNNDKPEQTPEQTLEGHEHKVDGAGAVSPDGKSLAWGSTLGEVRLWGVDDGKPPRVLKGPNAKATALSVAFSPDGLVAVGWDDGAISLWQTNGGFSWKKPLQHSKPVRTVAFSANGRWLASGSDDKTIIVWQFVRGVRR